MTFRNCCRFLAGEESIEDVKTSGLLDSWKVKYGIKHLGYTFSTLEDELTKRVFLYFIMIGTVLSFLNYFNKWYF